MPKAPPTPSLPNGYVAPSVPDDATYFQKIDAICLANPSISAEGAEEIIAYCDWQAQHPRPDTAPRFGTPEECRGLIKLTAADTFFTVLDKVKAAHPNLNDDDVEAKAESLLASRRRAVA